MKGTGSQVRYVSDDGITRLAAALEARSLRHRRGRAIRVYPCVSVVEELRPTGAKDPMGLRPPFYCISKVRNIAGCSTG